VIYPEGVSVTNVQEFAADKAWRSVNKSTTIGGVPKPAMPESSGVGRKRAD
jgi:hypothetical protein